MATDRFRPLKAAEGLLGEFREFALKGNVIDLAIGVIIGAAFGKIVSSLVDNILMPVVGLALPGDQSYQNWALEVGGQKIAYGLFLADVVNFVIVALALFFIMKKFLGWLMRIRKQQAVEAPPALTKDQELLIEIRDLLKARAG